MAGSHGKDPDRVKTGVVMGLTRFGALFAAFVGGCVFAAGAGAAEPAGQTAARGAEPDVLFGAAAGVAAGAGKPQVVSLSVSPAKGVAGAGEPVSISIHAADPEAQFRKLAIYVNDRLIAEPDSLPLELNSTHVPPGRYGVRVEAVTRLFEETTLEKPLAVRDLNFGMPTALRDFEGISVQDWNEAFLTIYGLEDAPGSHYGPEIEGGVLAWRLGYLLKAYVLMADVTSSPFYLEKARSLVAFMFDHTDRARAARGALDVREDPYHSGPQPLFDDKTLAAPGWRKVFNGETRIEPLIDGHIAHHIMQFVDLVLSDHRFSAYRPYARAVLTQVREIIDFHVSLWRSDRYRDVSGSYYNARRGGGIWSNPVPYNQSATMLAAALLVDRHDPVPEYREMARRLVAYFRTHMRERAGRLSWHYDPYDPENNAPSEDVGHGAIDVEFLVLAEQASIEGADRALMRKLARTFTELMAQSDGSVKHRVIGTGQDAKKGDRESTAFGWLALAAYEPSVYDHVLAIYQRYQSPPDWERGLAGWASLMKHHIARSRRTLASR